MTENESIKKWKQVYDDTDSIYKSDELDDMFKITIKALEKQIPKKPIYGEFDNNGYDQIIPYKAKCPICGYEFEFGTWNDEENHHCVCGQKIDWNLGI